MGSDTFIYRELAELGTATVYEASGSEGLIDADWIQIIPKSRVCGPARTVQCAQNDNRGAHEIMQYIQPGEIVVLTMPKPYPVALIGELLAMQAQQRQAAGILVDAAVRDTEELIKLGLPVWSRWIRIQGTTKNTTLSINMPIIVGGTRIETGDVLVLDSDGGVAISKSRLPDVLSASRARVEKESQDMVDFRAGKLSWELYGYNEQSQRNA